MPTKHQRIIHIPTVEDPRKMTYWLLRPAIQVRRSLVRLVIVSNIGQFLKRNENCIGLEGQLPGEGFKSSLHQPMLRAKMLTLTERRGGVRR